MLAAASGGYPFLDLMWTLLVFFGWVIWFWLLIVIFGDLFHRGDVSGWGKAGWTVLLIVLPFIGVLIYLVVQGRDMGERRRAKQDAAHTEFDDYVRSVSGSEQGAADQISAAKRLLDSGAIDNDEFQQLKRKALTG
ncbi:MAG TPA: SHOCT domain-containing protein [Pseudonocardiaceae bacterium]|nr:SHOCT domain-containing protein [Pseudonocardiaceae bacterium]